MKLLEVLLDLLYPPKCPFCDRLLAQGENGVCALCEQSLPRTKGEAKLVDGCDTCLSPVWYCGGVPNAIHRYKFNGGRTHAQLFGSLMAQCLSNHWHQRVDLVTWVPLAPKRLRERGYDQAELLARVVAKLASLPVAPTLVKVKNTKTQSQLEKTEERAANVLGAYQPLTGLDLAHQRVLLIDDVATTGATLSQCAACLQKAGAQSIIALTFARAR